MFCHITRTWSARPLMTIEDAVAGIAATITGQGLKCTAVRDDGSYPAKVQVSDTRMRWLEEHVIIRHGPHPSLNCTILPVPRGIAGPQPQPARPGRVPQDALNHPALTGMAPGDVKALAAALEVPFGARREHDNYVHRGRARVNGVRDGGGSNGRRRIDVLDHVLALRLRDHLGLPARVTSALLGVDQTTISHALTLTGGLLAAAGIPVPDTTPPETVPRTPGELLEYAAAAGITLTLPQNGQTMPDRFRTRQRQAAQTRPKQET